MISKIFKLKRKRNNLKTTCYKFQMYGEMNRDSEETLLSNLKSKIAEVLNSTGNSNRKVYYQMTKS